MNPLRENALIHVSCSAGVCHTGQSHPHQQTGSDQAGGVSLHLPVEPWRRGCVGGHVLLPASLWGGGHPLQCGRAARAHDPAQLQHLYRARLCQQYDGYRLVVQQSLWHRIRLVALSFRDTIFFFAQIQLVLKATEVNMDILWFEVLWNVSPGKFLEFLSNTTLKDHV